MSGRQRQYAKKSKEQRPKRKYPKGRKRGGAVSDSPVWEYDAYRDRRLARASRPETVQEPSECGH